MNGIKTKRILGEMMESNDKIRKVMELMKEAKDIVNVPRVCLSDILLKLNQDEILIDQQIEVSGYLSNAAYFDFPRTYATTSISDVGDVSKYRREIDKNGEEKMVRDFHFTVKELYPPLFYNVFSEKDEILCFLYEDPNCMKIDIVYEEDKYTIKMNDQNKYIPVVVSQSVFQKFRNKHVKALAYVNIMNRETASMFSENSDSEYKKLIEYFYDPNFMDFKVIYLTLQYIQIESMNCISKVYYNYGLEFAFSNTDVSEDIIIKKINQVMKKYAPTENAPSIPLGNNRRAYFVKEKFSVHYFEKKIGFFSQFSDDIMKQHEERKEFFEKINEIVDSIHLKCEVSFISNEEDLKFFEQNKGIEYN